MMGVFPVPFDVVSSMHSEGGFPHACWWSSLLSSWWGFYPYLLMGVFPLPVDEGFSLSCDEGFFLFSFPLACWWGFSLGCWWGLSPLPVDGVFSLACWWGFSPFLLKGFSPCLLMGIFPEPVDEDFLLACWWGFSSCRTQKCLTMNSLTIAAKTEIPIIMKLNTKIKYWRERTIEKTRQWNQSYLRKSWGKYILFTKRSFKVATVLQ